MPIPEGKVKLSSLPSREAWIEIPVMHVRRAHWQSLPSREAWIEMLLSGRQP